MPETHEWQTIKAFGNAAPEPRIQSDNDAHASSSAQSLRAEAASFAQPNEWHITNPTYSYVTAFADELQRMGLRHIVICPGSRSTPLAMAFSAQPSIRVWMHLDERSAAFFALGMAKRLNEVVGLLCTSGTAAANFLPAVVEARLTHVPLLVLTADRPHELRESGAPQAIDQIRLYGTHVKWFIDAALPEATNASLRYIRTLADRAVALARAVPAGPVHLNMPFREPLTPEALPGASLPPPAQRDATAWEGRSDNTPFTVVSDAPPGMISTTQSERLLARLRSTRRGLIIAGPGYNTESNALLRELARRLGYPLLADPLSQLRCGPAYPERPYDDQPVLSSYDAFLRDETWSKYAVPQLVLRFGAMPTSKPVLQYLQRHAACPQIVVDGNGGWEEPTHLAAEVIHADTIAFCQHMLCALETLPPVSSSDTPDQNWLTTWQQADRVTREALYTGIQDFTPLFEGRIFSELATLLPEQATLYVGNSMPVRDLDTFFWNNPRSVRILGNRGANGIDGVISSALGASAATMVMQPGTIRTPTLLVIGDLSFFHDLNGLLAAHLHQLDLVIILVNNDGGGIFSFLPQAAYPEQFEQLFGTPSGLNFQPVVQMYGGTFRHVEDWHDFRQAVQTGMTTGGLHVIEVPTERSSNVMMHRQLWQVVERALREQVPML